MTCLEIKIDLAAAIEEGTSLHEKNKWTLQRFKDMRNRADDDKVLLSKLTMEDVTYLQELIQKQPNPKLHRGTTMQLTSMLKVMTNPTGEKIGYLRNGVAAICGFIENNAIDGWLYTVTPDGMVLPYLVTNVVYREPRRDSDSRPTVDITLKFAKQGKSCTKTLCFDSDDISGHTVETLLAAHGFIHETAELRTEYNVHDQNYLAWRNQTGVQFTGRGIGYPLTQSSWREAERINLSSGNGTVRLIVDEDIIDQRISSYEADSGFWEMRAEENGVEWKGGFNTIPIHPFILTYHLGLHQHVWVHAKYMEPYRYNPALRTKLVLPADHKELIDILTTDMNILTRGELNDFIQGKGQSVIILCKGGPGLGKTLTAEVYSEVVGRPLYRVPAGILGTDAVTVEKNLRIIMERANRWNAILLIDEADVYIRARNDDMAHNAIVATWLIAMEQFVGLMFLTTNRGADVDDAIAHRCIAKITYGCPDEDNRYAIWGVQAETMGITLSDSLRVQLAKAFPNAVGRDIKELLRLTAVYAQTKDIDLDIAAFRICAIFREVEFKDPDTVNS